jgi:hypothetical protein
MSRKKSRRGRAGIETKTMRTVLGRCPGRDEVNTTSPSTGWRAGKLTRPSPACSGRGHSCCNATLEHAPHQVAPPSLPGFNEV